MFRLVKTLVGEEAGLPAFFMLCDHRQCMDARRGTAIMGSIDEYRLSKKQFLAAAIEEGWVVDLEGAFCPVHGREMLFAAQAAMEKARQVVKPARLEDICAFGKGSS